MVEQAEFDSSQPQVFMSYVRADDDYLDGGITWLRGALERAVEANTGIPLKIFQDVEDIVPGDQWENKLDEALENAQLFIPILTPRFFKSKFCRREASSFLDHEKRAKRNDLIIPIYLIGIDFLEDAEKRAEDQLAAKLYKRQYDDWRKLRFDLCNSATRPKIEKLADILAKAARLRPQSYAQYGDEEGEKEKIAPQPGDLKELDPAESNRIPAEKRPTKSNNPNEDQSRKPKVDNSIIASREKGPLLRAVQFWSDSGYSIVPASIWR